MTPTNKDKPSKKSYMTYYKAMNTANQDLLNERINEGVELYSPQVAGWKKGYYTERDFDSAEGEFFMDGDELHFVLTKTFGGYKGGDKFTERVLDIKLDPISVGRLAEKLQDLEGFQNPWMSKDRDGQEI